MQRMHNPVPDPTGWRCGVFELQPGRRRLLRSGVPVEVEERVFDLIVLLAAHHERALDRREITTALWGARPVSETTLRQLVYKARRALDDDGQRQSVIRTLHGRSLQWVAPIEATGTDTLPDARASGPAPRRVRRGLAALAAGLLVAIVGGVLLYRQHATVAHAPMRVAVVPIDNATGDAALDWTRNGLPGLLSSLLDSGGGIEVVEPRVAAQAWDFRRAADTSREAQLRLATGAGVVIRGSLRKLQAALFELDLDVVRAAGPVSSLRITGERPGTLAADAVPRLRRELHLAPPPTPRDAPADPFVSEAYARGLDSTARGRMDEAQAYFEVCVRDAPASLACGYGLGAAQVATRKLDEGEATLQRVLAAAGQRHEDAFVVRALDELAYVDIMRHRFKEARELLQHAGPRLGRVDADIRVTHALRLADVSARLRDVAAADAALAGARTLIARHALRLREADLHNAEAIIAQARGDEAASERAQRDALAASEALGNERDAAGDAYNLALVLSRRGRRDQALPLLARAYAAAKGKDAWLEFGAGDNLAIGLLAGGMDRNAAVIADGLGDLARRQDNRSWQTLVHLLEGAIALYRSDPASARRAFGAADALLDAGQDPSLAGATLLYLATAVCADAPGELPALVRRIDRLAAAQPAGTPGEHYHQHLVHALADAAAGRVQAARADLADAMATPHADDTGEGDLRMVALTVGLRAPAAAADVIAAIDVERCEDAGLLRLYSAWARAQGSSERAARADVRLAAIEAQTTDVLAGQSILAGSASGPALAARPWSPTPP